MKLLDIYKLNPFIPRRRCTKPKMNHSNSNNLFHTFDSYKAKPNQDWQLHSSDERDKLVSQSHEESYLLNPMAVFIWTFCDGKTEVRAIRAALEEVFVESRCCQRFIQSLEIVARK